MGKKERSKGKQCLGDGWEYFKVINIKMDWNSDDSLAGMIIMVITTVMVKKRQ